VTPQVVEEKASDPVQPKPVKPVYPRKNVILTLNDHSELHGDILGDDGENYIVRLKDRGGELSIPKTRVVRID